MNLITSNQLTMSTREIAAMLGKNNSDIKRSALRLEQKGLLTQPLAEFNYDHKGNIYGEYKLNKRDSILLVAQNSPEFTAAIVDRWQELESQVKPPAQQLPQNYLEALEHLVEKEKLLIAQAPKVAFVDNLVTRHNLLNATQIGQPHKISAVKLNKILDEVGGVYNKSVKRGRAFCQPWVDGGYGEMKVTESGHNQCLFTTLGEQKINNILISEGVV